MHYSVLRLPQGYRDFIEGERDTHKQALGRGLGTENQGDYELCPRLRRAPEQEGRQTAARSGGFETQQQHLGQLPAEASFLSRILRGRGARSLARWTSRRGGCGGETCCLIHHQQLESASLQPGSKPDVEIIKHDLTGRPPAFSTVEWICLAAEEERGKVCLGGESPPRRRRMLCSLR